MSWLLEILCSIFDAIFDLLHRTKLGGKSEAKWFHYSLATSCYLLPTLLVVSVFISRKITVIAAGLFMVSLMAGAAAETDDWGAR